MGEFKRLFKRDGTPWAIRKSTSVKRRSAANAKKTAAAKLVEIHSEIDNKNNTSPIENAAVSRDDSLLVGEVMLIERIARQIGLRANLASVWGEQAADAVISLACFFLTTGKFMKACGSL